MGSIGDMAGFSFGGKHLSGGTGGAVLTNDTALWERAVLFHDVALPRANGPYADRPYGHHFLAPHYIINDLTAAVLLVQLEKVDGYIASKIRAARQIIDGLADIDELTRRRCGPGTDIPIGFSGSAWTPNGWAARPTSLPTRCAARASS